MQNISKYSAEELWKLHRLNLGFQWKIVKILGTILASLINQSVGNIDSPSLSQQKNALDWLVSMLFCKFWDKISSTYHSSSHLKLSLSSTTSTMLANSWPMRKSPPLTKKSKPNMLEQPPRFVMSHPLNTSRRISKQAKSKNSKPNSEHWTPVKLKTKQIWMWKWH